MTWKVSIVSRLRPDISLTPFVQRLYQTHIASTLVQLVQLVQLDGCSATSL